MNFVVDENLREVRMAGKSLSLRNKEYDLLGYFISNAGRLITRAELLEEVWDQNICCSTNTVDVHVSTLRKRLSEFDLKGLIRTVHCRGYVFQRDF